LSVGADEGGLQVFLLGAGSCGLDHRRGYVYADAPVFGRDLPGDGEGGGARAAADIEYTFW
jgi:hypothetical protein